MAITRDSHTALTASSSGATSYTFSHTVSGSDTYLVVPVYEQGSGDTVSTVTFNGAAASFLGKAKRNTADRNVYLYGLVAPDSGTHDVVVSRSGSSLAIFAGATSYNGVDQSTPTDGVDTDSGNSTSVTSNITTTVDDCVFTGITVFSGGTPTAGTGAVRMSFYDITAAFESSPLLLGAAGAESITMNGLNNYGQVTVALRPTGGGGGGGGGPAFSQAVIIA